LKETLSASKIKVLKSCSWQYWSKYHLKLPDKTNSGALKGDTVHIVLECLGNERHKKHYDSILKSKKISSCKSIERLIKKHIKRKNLNYEEDLDDIHEMIIKGLNYDFFGNKYGKPSESISEKDFELEVNDGDFKYKVKGFIDKLFIYESRGLVLIRDFKTNKKMYEGKEISDNLQDYIYTLAIRKLFPQYKDVKMEFLFLKQDIPKEGVMLMEPKNKQDIDGFQYELSELQTYADKFNEKLAVSNLAFNQGMPKDGSFSGKLLCGFASKPNQLKKDGSPMWYCSFKFGFDYYVVIDKDKKIKKSVYTKQELSNYKLEAGDKIEKRKYDGCPCFNKPKADDEFDLDKF
jgi:hypothetical protein